MKYKKIIQRCYFVAIEDENGNEVDCDYIFDSKPNAEKVLNVMIDTAQRRQAAEEQQLEGQMSFGDIQ